MQYLGIPRGMRDILSDESSERTMLQEKLRNYIQSCGFCRIETPLFEYYDLFSQGFSPIDEESIIKMIDREGKVVVLRPDLTIPAARVVATKLKEQPKPIKLFYIGNVYRADRKNRGAVREFCQIGAEIYGCSGKWTDLELISMVRGCFKEAKVSGYKIDIGHVGITGGIFNELGLTEEKKAYIIGLIGDKNLVELEKEVSALDISDRHKEIICRLPCFFGNPEDVFSRIDELSINDTVKQSVDYLYEVYTKSREMGIAFDMMVDAGMTGNMNYYTGLVFKAYAKEAGSAVASGGRYDSLLGGLGADCPAAGFAIDVDGMMKAAVKGFKQRREQKILVVYIASRFVEAVEYSERCRKGGETVNLINCGDMSDLEQYRKQYRYDEVIIFE